MKKTLVTSLTLAQVNALYASIMMDKGFREKFLQHPREATTNRFGFSLSDDECAEVNARVQEIRKMGEDTDEALKGTEVKSRFIKYLGLGDDGGDIDP